STVYYSGSQEVTLRTGETTDPILIQLGYVGPGTNVQFVNVSPQNQTLFAPATQTLQATAYDANEAVVMSVPLNWSVNDVTLATIAGNGSTATLTPTGKRGVVTVRALTPTGISNTTQVTIVPPASKLTVLNGSGQSAVVGTALKNPFQVRVDGADGLPVRG